MTDYALLKKMTDAAGVSGMEYKIAQTIMDELDACFHKIQRDSVGNIYVTNPGKPGKNKVIVDAHMDDVGVQITGATQDGKLRFYPVGGTDEFTLLGKSVSIGECGLSGIFCANTHIKNNPISYSDMYIEIGCDTREEAERYFSIGDDGSFESEFVEFGDGFLKARNFDDRLGCAIMVELLKERLDVEFTAVFTVREEVGLYGSKTAAFQLQADVAICLEGGGSADIPFFEEDEKVSVLGHGPALSVRNQYSIFDGELNRKVMKLASEQGIKCQLRRGNAGGCDGHSLQQVGKGAKTITLAPPNRYIHTHNTVISAEDYENAKKLTRALIVRFSQEELG